MNQVLRPNEVVETLASKKKCRVEQFLGGGGQGEVFSANVEGTAVALKWYFPHTATDDQRATLQELIKSGPPDSRFLWPLDLVTGTGIEGFGYVMPLRDARYKGIPDLLKRRIDPSFRALAIAGCQLADGYLRLHSRGMCYRDINWGNIFFDPKTGEVLICDNDNVAVDKGERSGVGGTLGFMAPEIVRGEAHPSTQTDLFSLSVLLFYMFMVHHPLNGKKESEVHCLDSLAMQKLYGTDPIFIFDPNNDSNRPVRDFHDNALAFWPLYPEFLRKMFERAFTDGIRDPQNGRVRESEWRAAMVRLRDSIIYCPSCRNENFYDSTRIQTDGGIGKCWSCQNALKLPARIRFGPNNVVMLRHDAELCQHHIDATSGYDFAKVIACIAQHPNDPTIFGLKNSSVSRWTCTYPDGRITDVDPGKSVTLQSGIRINFGMAEGEIR